MKSAYEHGRVFPKGTLVKIMGRAPNGLSEPTQMLYSETAKDMLEEAVVLAAVYGFGKRKVFGAHSQAGLRPAERRWIITTPQSGAELLHLTVSVETENPE